MVNKTIFLVGYIIFMAEKDSWLIGLVFNWSWEM